MGDDLNSTLESYLINFIGKLSILSINKEATLEARRADMIIKIINKIINPEGVILKRTIIIAGTFSQLYIQTVFAVKGRENLIDKKWRDELCKYISGIIKGKVQKSIIVNGVADHIHCFTGLKPNMSISDLMRDVKNNSSKFINDKGFVKDKFSWQEGYGAFSYSHSQIEQVYNYILNQEMHHQKKTFKEEYLEFLTKYEIEYKNEYLFDWLE